MKKRTGLLISILACSVMTAFAANEIVINEIMYNSEGTDVEFIELYNTSAQEVNTQNWYIIDDSDAHTPCKITVAIKSGEYLVIAQNIAMFKVKYPAVTNINGNEYGTGTSAWSFGNGGDVVRLFNGSGTLQDTVAYSDGGDWPGSPDGNGPSLELLHPALDNSLPTSWDPSLSAGGTPGKKNSTYTENVSPFCRDGQRNISLPTSVDNVIVTVEAFDNEGLAKVELFVNTGSGYVVQAMSDNGSNGDSIAGDSVFTAIISAKSNGTLVKFYALATDNIGQTDYWPKNAPIDYSAYTVGYNPRKLRITEVLPVNDAVNKDEVGEYDDWFEIQNQDVVSVNLGGMFVSSDLGNSQAFELPAINLAPNQFILIWADNQTDQGTLHADFKLAADGEAVAIFETIDHGNVLIDGWKYGISKANISMGFLPMTGTSPEYLNAPTPAKSNETSTLFSPICINEFQCTSDFGGTDDWVEIYNRGTKSYDLSGCYLSDERGQNTKWKFPSGVASILEPGQFLVVYEDALQFGFSSEGQDVIMLSAADGITGLDFYDFGQQTADRSEGRYPDGINTWKFYSKPTKGATNTNPDAVADPQPEIDKTFVLHQNFPNPFNPKTTIRYELIERSHVKITVYDMLGREITTLLNTVQQAGAQNVDWDAADATGRVVPSGIYFYKIQAANFNQTRKMLLMR